MRNSRWLLLLVAVSLVACTSTPSGTYSATPTATAESARLDRLVDDYFEEALRLNPLVATYIGDSRYNDRLAIDIAPDHVAAMTNSDRCDPTYRCCATDACDLRARVCRGRGIC
jgi:hypothetical protein